MKYLIALCLTGCISSTHAVITKQHCEPPALVLADVLGSSMITTFGIAENEPGVVAFGTVALVTSTINWIDQMATCHHIH